MSPMISVGGKKNQKIPDNLKEFIREKKKLIEIRKYIEKNFEYVGKNFSKKVREIYYDKKNKKTIYGTTTPQEREDLAEEGIDLISVPWIDKEN